MNEKNKLLSNLELFFNKVIVFFSPEKASYWHSVTPNILNEKPVSIERYYLDFNSKINYPQEFDKMGIPLYNTPENGITYFPIVICQYALGIYEHLFRSDFTDQQLRNKFLAQADWLIINKNNISNGSVWYINYNRQEFGLVNEWISAMAQGEAVSVLTRAYFLTKDEVYLQVAEEAINMFDVPVKNGGLLNYFKGYPVYEEYPSTYRTVAVLNGLIFAIFGLYDLILTNNSSRAKQLFDNGIESLKELLPYYDTGYWCRYYLFDYPKKIPGILYIYVFSL